MGLWTRIKFLSPGLRRREELEMRAEMDALAGIAGRKELGNLTLAMENARSTWGWTWAGTIAADVRFALRTLGRQPAFLTVAVLSLGLAIGANSAIFSFADALLLRPPSVPAAAALLDVSYTTPDIPLEGMSFPDYRDLREKGRSFAGLAAYRLAALAASTDPAVPARIRLASLVSDNFFRVTEIAPAAGRSFTAEESAAPGEPVAMISYDFWKQAYSGSQTAVGVSLRLNGVPCTIVGVTPEGFNGLDRFSQPTIYVPLRLSQRLAAGNTDPLEDRGRRDLTVKGRLAAGASLGSARAELATLGADLEREYPSTNRNRHAAVRTELEKRILQTPQLLALIKMLMGLVGLILVLACCNLANLLLARGRARSREIAVRLSIGAGRTRLLRQLMTESLIVAVAGGMAGLAFAYGGIRLLQTLNVPSDPPSVLGVQLDVRVVVFSMAAALLSCLFFGLAPAWQTARPNLVDALKSGGADLRGRRTLGRDALVTGQVALAVVILIAAGMFVAGFRKMVVTKPEFRTDHLISMDTAPAMLHYSPEQARTFYRQLLDRVKTTPGVAGTAMIESLPLSVSQSTLTIVPEGYQFPKGRQAAVVFGGSAAGDYFRTMNVEITRGRPFTESDSAEARRVAIVNQQFAKTYWPGQDPIGKRIRVGNPQGAMAEVVGIARTGHYLTVNEAPASYVYLPYEQNPRPRMTLVVQSAGDPASLAEALREAVRALDPNLPVFNLRTVKALYESRATDTWLQFSEMVGTMGVIGLVLATIGLYGLIAYAVSQRVKELGIRVALGASRRDIVWLVERRGLVLAGIGVAMGGILAAATRHVLTAAFSGLEVTSPAVYACVAVLLLAVSAAASYLPARRAGTMDPLRALRNE